MADPILNQKNLLSQIKKQCSICKEFKTVEEFGKRSSTKSGIHSQCKKCRKKLYQKHKAKMARIKAKTIRTCSVCKEIKSIDNFGRRSDVKSGLHSQCNSCRAEFRRDNRYKAIAYNEKLKCKHMPKLPEYKAWKTMKRNSSVPIFPGWIEKNGFDLFLESVGQKPWKKSVLGKWCLSRIDFNIGFIPGNCKWEPQGVASSRFRRWKASL